MPQPLRAIVGKRVPIVLRLREVALDSTDGRSFHPLGVHVVHIKDPSGATIVSNASMVPRTDGEFVYYFDTSAQSPGDYEVRLAAKVNSDGDEVAKAFVLRLVKGAAP